LLSHSPGRFLHIDFGFILNDQPGFDAPIFSIPRGVKKHLSTNEWDFFLSSCIEAFAVLHKNFEIVMNACVACLAEVIPVEQVRKYLVQSLMVGMTEGAARAKIRTLVIEGSASTKKEMKYLMHDIALKINQ
jgi:hypothetical protein